MERYQGTVDNRIKVETLFHFFEAVSEFIFIILISGYYHDSSRFQLAKEKCFSKEKKGGESTFSIKRATFATWIDKAICLGKLVRKELENGDTCHDCLKHYGIEENSCLRITCNEELFEALKEAKQHRNDFKGHGGAIGDKETADMLRKLEMILERVHALLQASFFDKELVIPDGLYHDQGRTVYTVKLLKGVKPPRQLKIETKRDLIMERNTFYIVNKSSDKPIENALRLVPLMKLGPPLKPETLHDPNLDPMADLGACYFYNKIDDKGIKWVSYHYETRPDFNDQDP
nr:hypothetical protein [Candidatus Sigynarchaeota archaeon]